MSAEKLRLDELLVAKGLAGTRSQAKALILAGKVRIGTQRLDKPGHTFPVDSSIHVETPPRFVSRGGEKLEGFLERFNFSNLCDASWSNMCNSSQSKERIFILVEIFLTDKTCSLFSL